MYLSYLCYHFISNRKHYFLLYSSIFYLFLVGCPIFISSVLILSLFYTFFFTFYYFFLLFFINIVLTLISFHFSVCKHLLYYVPRAQQCFETWVSLPNLDQYGLILLNHRFPFYNKIEESFHYFIIFSCLVKCQVCQWKMKIVD